MNFVITGILDKLTRHGAETMVKDHGHSVSDTVRFTTDYVVAGIRPGSKLVQAAKLGVKVINEEQFMKLMSELHQKGIAERESLQAKLGYALRLPKIPPKPFVLDTKPGIYFMVGEIHYDYDDQYYHRNGSAVDPTKLYRSRLRAEREMAKLEQQSLDKVYEHDLMHYCPEGESFESMFTNYGHFRAVMYKYGIELPEDGDDVEYGDQIIARCVQMLCRLSVDQFIEARRFMKFSFYELKEVAIGD